MLMLFSLRRHGAFRRRQQGARRDAGRDHRVRRPERDGAAAVHRRDRQVGAISAVRLAAGRDGRPHAGLRADPRGDDGDGRRLHGRPFARAVQPCAEDAGHRGHRRRVHGDAGRFDRPGAERYQARAGVLDSQPARLHGAGAGRRRILGRGLPPVHARVLQGAALPWIGLGDSRHVRRAGHAPHGSAQGQDSDYALDHVHRFGGDRRHSRTGGILLQGRDSLADLQLADRLESALRDGSDHRRHDGLLHVASDVHDVLRQAAASRRRWPPRSTNRRDR